MAGRIIHVDLPSNKKGRSRSFAVVEFDLQVENLQAISMFHNHRTMTVRMDRVSDNVKLLEGLTSIGIGKGPECCSHNLPSITGARNNKAGILIHVPNNSL